MGLGARVVRGSGVLLIVSGVFYLALFGIVGGSWAGATSLRKPILFGLSTGVTLLSLAWVIGGVRRRRLDDVLYASLGGALVIEVFLIDLQQARGVASHFNQATPVDATVSAIMTGLILYASAVIIELTVRTWGDMHFPPDETVAARWGMVLLTLGCVLGAAITLIGESRLVTGRSPETFGAAGVLKFPHGLPLHGIQILFVQVRLLRRWGAAVPARRRSSQWMVAALTSATAYAVVQTASGDPRWPPAVSALPFVLAAVVFGLAAVIAGFRR